jgi:hypothetical protein
MTMRFTQFAQCLVILMIGTATTFSQTPQAPPAQPNAPLELPDFLVTGKAVVDIAAGTKNLPSRPPTFSLAELDSLNPTEKLPPPLAARRPLPLFSRKDPSAPGYVDLSCGAYLTPALEAGYSLRTGGYTLDLGTHAEHSQGWVENSGYTTLQANLNSSYVAPEKFLYFGKGLTETDLQLRHQAYSLYGDTLLGRDRSSTALTAVVTTEAKVDNADITGRFGWSRTGLSTSAVDSIGEESSVDNAITAGVTASWTQAGSHRSAVELDMRLQSLNGDSYTFVEAQYQRRWKGSAWSYAVAGGPQLALTTIGQTRLGVRVAGMGQADLSPNSTLRIELASGLRPTSYRELLHVNPYIVDSVNLDHAYDLVDARVSLGYQPSIVTSVLLSAGFRTTSRELTWEDATQGRFLLSYRPVTALWAAAEGTHALTPRDVVTGDLQVTSASSDSGRTQTYVPLVRATVGYERIWSSQVRSSVSVLYTSQRWADVGNTRAVDGFIDLRAALVYAASSAMDVELRGENLVDSSVFLWNGYRGRGIFVRLGILLKL